MKKITYSILLLCLVFSAKANSSYYSLSLDDDDDAQTLGALFSTLMSAEGYDGLLDVQLTVTESSSSMVLFSVNTAASMQVTLNLTDLQGSMLAERQFEIQNGANYRALNVSELPEGNYILTVSQGNKKVQKLIGIVKDHSED